MNGASRRNLTALLSGVIFGAGLVVSRMTDPRKVLAFLDVFGAWDPSLALVMASALGIAALAFRWSRGRAAPLSAQAFTIPANAPLDRALVVGAALFGVGWGLSGYCPGPSIVALAAAGSGTTVFVLATLFGILLAARLERTQHRRSSDPGELGKPVTS